MDFTEAAPFGLKTLVRKLPGQPRIRLGEILTANSFVALVMPAIAAMDWDHPDAKFNETNVCLICAAMDTVDIDVGVSYLRTLAIALFHEPGNIGLSLKATPLKVA